MAGPRSHASTTCASRRSRSKETMYGGFVTHHCELAARAQHRQLRRDQTKYTVVGESGSIAAAPHV